MIFTQIKAPAKINLGLRVISKRSDGYHNIETIFYPLLDLFDTLEFHKSIDNTFTCSDHELLKIGENNLVLRSKRLLEKVCGRKLNVDIHLIKRIPYGSGLGGGSSDAAATLLSLNELFELNITPDYLAHLALEVGSDVPYFLKPKVFIGRSRGELLSEIDARINKPLLIINPGILVSTKDVFEHVKTTETYLEKISIELKQENFVNYVAANAVNDFENYVFNKYPEIKAIKKKMYSSGAAYAQMSGTGSTVFGIFESVKVAENAFNQFPEEYFRFISLPQEF